MTGIQLTAKIVTYGTTAVCSLFVVLYWALSRGDWARREVGWQMMVDRVILAAVFVMLTAANLWPWLAGQVWYLWIYVCFVGSIPLAIMWQITILWRLNRRM